MDLKLEGKRAVVIGGSRGIGLAVCEALVAEGAYVALCSRTESEVQAAVASLSSGATTAEGQAIDVRDPDALGQWLDRVASGGGIDIAVLCASALAVGDTETDWQNSIDIDILGSVNAMKLLGPHLEQAAAAGGDASLVQVSTVSVTESVFQGSYGPAKAAVTNYCKLMAKTLAPKNVRVNVVTLGTVFVEGGGWDKVKTAMPDRFEAALARNPMGRMATPEEIADSIAFLSSPRSSFTTGANLVIDGALTHAVHY